MSLALLPHSPEGSKKGTHGGLILMHRANLMITCPHSSGPQKFIYSSDLLVWKLVRVRGITFKLAFAYLQDGVASLDLTPPCFKNSSTSLITENLKSLFLLTSTSHLRSCLTLACSVELACQSAMAAHVGVHVEYLDHNGAIRCLITL